MFKEKEIENVVQVTERQMREKVVQGMYRMATVKWTPTDEFTEITKATVEKIRDPYTVYKVGETYYGLPFTKGVKVSVDDFLKEMKDGRLLVPEKKTAVAGVDCTASMIFPLNDFTSINERYLTNDFIWNRLITTPLAKIDLNCEKVNSDMLSKRYSPEVYYEGYAKLEIGDILCSHFVRTSGSHAGLMVDHTRLVSGTTHVVYKEDGTIDPKESYVIIIENTAALMDATDANNFGGNITEEDYVVPYEPDLTVTDIKKITDLKDKLTNFKVNRKISFESLFVNHYIPMTFNIYHKKA